MKRTCMIIAMATLTAATAHAQKPDSLPTFASLQLYATDSPLNTPIPANAPLDPNSDGYVALVNEVFQDGGFVIGFR